MESYSLRVFFAFNSISNQDGHGGLLAAGEKKRKRTSIAAPEKRSLEAYFAVQVRFK